MIRELTERELIVAVFRDEADAAEKRIKKMRRLEKFKSWISR